MTTTRKPTTCAAAADGCTCHGDVVQHNLFGIKMIQKRQADAPRTTCPQCGESGNAAIIAGLGRCFACKKAEDGVKYGIDSWTKR